MNSTSKNSEKLRTPFISFTIIKKRKNKNRKKIPRVERIVFTNKICKHLLSQVRDCKSVEEIKASS